MSESLSKKGYISNGTAYLWAPGHQDGIRWQVRDGKIHYTGLQRPTPAEMASVEALVGPANHFFGVQKLN